MRPYIPCINFHLSLSSPAVLTCKEYSILTFSVGQLRDFYKFAVLVKHKAYAPDTRIPEWYLIFRRLYNKTVRCLDDDLPYPPRFEDLDTKHLNSKLHRARVLKFTHQENAVQMRHELFMAKRAHSDSVAEDIEGPGMANASSQPPPQYRKGKHHGKKPYSNRPGKHERVATQNNYAVQNQFGPFDITQGLDDHDNTINALFAMHLTHSPHSVSDELNPPTATQGTAPHASTGNGNNSLEGPTPPEPVTSPPPPPPVSNHDQEMN